MPLCLAKNRPLARGVWFALLLLLLSGCDEGGISQTKTFKVTIDTDWSTTTHTSLGSSGRLSSGVGLLHKDTFSLWAVDQIATSGLRTLAENGQTANAIAEIDKAIADEEAKIKFTTSSITTVPGETSFSLTADKDYPCLSFAMQIVSSPDWFIGLSCLKLIENDSWISTKTIAITPYDAGTDAGTGFNASNAPLVSQINITASNDAVLKNTAGEYAIGNIIIEAQ